MRKMAHEKCVILLWEVKDHPRNNSDILRKKKSLKHSSSWKNRALVLKGAYKVQVNKDKERSSGLSILKRRPKRWEARKQAEIHTAFSQPSACKQNVISTWNITSFHPPFPTARFSPDSCAWKWHGPDDWFIKKTCEVLFYWNGHIWASGKASPRVYLRFVSLTPLLFWGSR